jgi:hypothetical protein
MWKPLVKLSCILLAGSVGVCPEAVFAQGSTHEEDETQLAALENAWDQADLHNDPAALKGISRQSIWHSRGW